MPARAPPNPRQPRPRTLGIALVIEDDAIIAMALEDALGRGGASEVVTCATSAEGMAALERLNPDVVVLDVHLADRDDGWRFAELITMLGPHSPRIVFSTGAPEAIPPEVAALGLVMAKPYDPDDLVAVLHRQKRPASLLGRLRSALGA